jgi:hypothetical protein
LAGDGVTDYGLIRIIVCRARIGRERSNGLIRIVVCRACSFKIVVARIGMRFD